MIKMQVISYSIEGLGISNIT